MRICYYIIIALLITVIGSRAPLSAQQPPPTQPAPTSRADLVVPDEIWARVLHEVGFDGKKLGFTADEMANFKTSQYILPTVENLFRDITSVPRFTGRISDALLATPDDIANAAALAFSIIGGRGGRGLTAPVEGDWGVDWIQKSTSVDDALDIILDKAGKAGMSNPMPATDRAEWEKLPEAARRLALRMVVAQVDATPWVQESFDSQFLKNHFNVDDLDKIPRDQLYQFASMPWQDKAPPLVPKDSFDLLAHVDLNYMSYGAIDYLTLTQGAIKEFQAANVTNFGDFKGCTFDTTVGKVAIFGTGDDTISGDYSLVIDLGGNDKYTGPTATPQSFSAPISTVIDLSGNDTYGDADSVALLACGNFGIGAIFDLAGNDTYTCKESGIGCAWYGMGLVVDYSGDDVYTTKFQNGQGAAHAGVGMLIDLAGNDKYYTVQESQGFASTLGCGILLDVSGNDIYYADPKGNVDPVFEGRTTSFVQGAGFGRRADFGDGHSFGGGVGMLVDGAGDDSYTGSVYSQGAGYWWSLGFLEDRSGNDTYYNEQYSGGSAPHFAIGCLVDLSGDDKYNIGNVNLARQVQACARDGSMAVFIDGSGNDQYNFDNFCAGSAHLNCISLFWDRCGDDTYTARSAPTRAWDRGASRSSSPRRGSSTNIRRPTNNCCSRDPDRAAAPCCAERDSRKAPAPC